MTDLRSGIIRYIKKLKRMKRWAIENNDPVVYRLCKKAIPIWMARLRHLFRQRGYDV